MLFHLARHSHQLKQFTVSFFHPQRACRILAEIVVDKNTMWFGNTEKTFTSFLVKGKQKRLLWTECVPSITSKFIYGSPIPSAQLPCRLTFGVGGGRNPCHHDHAIFSFNRWNLCAVGGKACRQSRKNDSSQPRKYPSWEISQRQQNQSVEGG